MAGNVIGLGDFGSKDPLGLFKQAPGLRQPESAKQPARSSPRDFDAESVIREFEGFRNEPYWDVNALRVGYGSDTITLADGTVKPVEKGDRVSRDDGERDLARRIDTEFVPAIVAKVGTEAWGALPAPTKAALTSVTYNYGNLPDSVAAAVATGDGDKIAAAVEALGSHNDGVNADRRSREAAIIRGGGTSNTIVADGSYTPSDPMRLYPQRRAPLDDASSSTAEGAAEPARPTGPSQAEQIYQQLEAENPGRYKLVGQDEVGAWQEEWKGTNQSKDILGDTWRLLGMGQVGVEQSMRELVGQIPVVGKSLVEAGDNIDRWMYGKPSEERYEELYTKDEATLTDATRIARDKKWWDEKTGSLGSAWLDPRSYFSGVVESIPGTVVTMLPAMSIARGAYAAALLKTGSEKAASAAAARAALFSGALLEGGMGGADTARGVRAEIEAIPREQLVASDAVQALIHQGMSEEAAIDAITNDAATQAFLVGGVATGLFGGFGDRFLAKIFAEGVGGTIGKRIGEGIARGVVAEGVLEEAPQSAGGAFAQNLAIKNTVDPNRDLTAGVADAALGGAAVGAAMGAGFGGVGGAARPRADVVPPAAPAQVAPPAPAPVKPKGPLVGALEHGVVNGAAPAVDLATLGEDATPKASSTVTLPPEIDLPTVPAEYVGYPEAGKRVIVDNADLGRFPAKVEGYVQADVEGGGQRLEALVISDDGESLQVPATDLQVTRLTQQLLTELEQRENPPVEREPADTDPLRSRTVNGKTIVMPDETLAKLYDLGKERKQSKRLTGATGMDMREVVSVNGTEFELADALGVPREKINEIADDYRYRVEKAARSVDSDLPHNMHGLNKEKLKAWQAQRASAPSLPAANNPENPDGSTAIEVAAHEAATSPRNDRPEPTPAQKEAGNYKLGHISLGGMDISIENPAGSERKGVDKGGKEWSVTMKSHYGYFKGTEGKDKDHIDVFVAKGTEALDDDAPVFVVDQVNGDGQFDEHKVMLGYQEPKQARRAYLANYTKGWKGLGAITPTTLGEFKQWLADGDTKKEFAKSAKTSAEDVPSDEAFYADKAFPDDRDEAAETIAAGERERVAQAESAAKEKPKGAVEVPAADLVRDARLHAAVFRLLKMNRAVEPLAEALAKDRKQAEIIALFNEHVGRHMPGVGGYEDRIDLDARPNTLNVLMGDEAGNPIRARFKGGVLVKLLFWTLGSGSKYAEERTPAEAAPSRPLPNATAPEHAEVGVDDRELGAIVSEFKSAQSDMMEGEHPVSNIFQPPAKKDVVRLADKVKVYHKQHGWMTPAEAKATIDEWKAAARAQGEDPAISSANSNKVVLSLFDLSGEWSRPWEEAGYQVYRFDIQADPEVGDVNNFSVEFFGDWFGDFDGQDIYAVLAACPCTDFAVSGARHFAAKDADGRTVASVKLVHQTLRVIEYFKPAVWALENPVGRIEELGGLPPWRLSFDPNHLGDSYTKKTLIWGRFNGDLPIAPVEPTEGSKMHRQYGGKSLATKNARSVTPEGFSYGFFMANNAHDHAAMALANKFDRLDRALIQQAIDAGVSPDEIQHRVEDFYYMDLDDEAANDAIRELVAAAEQGDEAPETQVSPNGPWDFNDRYPQPTTGGRDAAAVSAELEDVLQELVVAELDISDGNAELTKLRAAKKPDADAIGRLQRSVDEDRATRNGIRKSLGDRYAAEAVDAIMLEGEVRAARELKMRDPAVEKPRIPKAERFAEHPGIVVKRLRDGKETLIQPPGTTPPTEQKTWGSDNKLVSRDRAAEVREKLRAKLGGQLNSGIDPEVLALGAELAAFHIEAGARRFADFAKAVADDLGSNVEALRPYLRAWYNGARDLMEDSGLDIAGTDNADEVRAALAQLGKVDEPRELDQPGAATLEGAPAGAVPAVESRRSAEQGAEGSGRDDVSRDVGARGRRDASRRGLPAGEGTTPVPAGRDGRDAAAEPDASDDERAASRPSRDLVTAATPAQDRPVNYTITDADELGAGGAKTKFRNNVAAIELLRALDRANRPATRDEQAVLAKWVGWGGLQAAFPRQDGSVVKGWEREATQLKELLSPEEYRAAESSTRNAHYTSPEVVDAIWTIARQLGFRGGKALEPSVGAGNFIGLMPAELRPGVAVTGVELDRVTGGIAKHLYPDANINAPIGFQDFAVPDGYFDIAIGNPPFGSEKLYDKQRRHLNGMSIHNYFFAKSIDALRPGGVLAMVVTNYFLDAGTNPARDYIAGHADLVGAIRLPNDAFLKNAGTEVTTDIIIFQKRAEGVKRGDPDWLTTGSYRGKDGKAVQLNRYFIEHPDMMLGDFGAFGTMYRGDSAALVSRPGQDLATDLKQALAKLPADIMKPAVEPVQETVVVAMDVDSALVNSVFLTPEGAVMVRRPDSLGRTQAEVVAFASEKAQQRVAGMIRVRDVFSRLRKAQLDEASTDQQLDTLRARLNTVYDTFVKAHGPIHADANRRLMRDDPTWPQLAALEEKFDKGVSDAVAKSTGETARAPSAQKAPIFTKRTQAPYTRPTSAATAKDALTAVLNEVGRVDLEAMQRLYGKPVAEIVDELGSLLFRAPNGAYETADAYLSGNVKAKLVAAEEAAQRDPAFKRNVAALRDVIPADIEAVDIDVKPGSPWVPANHIADFLDHIVERKGGRATFSRANARWILAPANPTPAAEAQYGTNRVSAVEVLDAVLNARTITVYDVGADDKRVLNQAATDAANEKAARLKAEWRRWLWEDDARRDELSRLYNDTFNTDVIRQFDGSHLTLPGKVGDDIISFRPHQKNFVWRGMQTSTVLADHTVGAGKTFAAIALAMEKRRVGIAKKPMFVVPNHLVGQWAADFVKLYPGAKVLAATKADFEKENRKKLFARIATGDWDAVIVAHSSFGKIAVHPEFEAKFIQQQIADIEESERALRDALGKDARNVKQLSKWRDSMQEKLKRLLDAGAKDVGLTFEDLGIDDLTVDEAHEFKNLGFATSMTRVAGLGNTLGSQKAADLYMKIQSVLERTGGRNITFLTGTPISNTMAELFTVQRYLDNKALRAQGVAHFDAWASVFGEVVTDWELSPSGQYKLNSRFAKFVNMPELMQRYLSFADVITNDDIQRQLAAQGKRLPIPKVKGGKPQNVVVERSADQGVYIGVARMDPDGQERYPEGSLVWRAEHLPKRVEKGSDNMLKVMSDARKAALDMRLIDPSYRDVAGSKVHIAADHIVRLYKRWSAKKGTQLVFIDLSTPKGAKAKEEARIRELMAQAEAGDEAAVEALDRISPDEILALGSSFSVYDDLRQKLIDRGVPPAEIAFIHDANTDAQKEELFGKVRSGRVRILFGSTPKMGAGTNVQNRLVGLHHLDAPWRPSDLEQRDGRGIRQGNELYLEDPEGFEIEILRYATKNTLDARQWQTIEGKARFVQQMRKGDVKTRVIEDIAGEAANAAEMKAAASGNPLILEEMDLRQQVRRLEGLSAEHDREQHRIKGKLRSMREEAARLADQMPAVDEDAAMAAEALETGFPATIDGQQVEKAGQLGAAMLAAMRRMLEAVDVKPAELGMLGKFRIGTEMSHGKTFDVTIDGAREHGLSIEDVEKQDNVGLGTSILQLLRSLVKVPAVRRERVAEIERDIPALEKQTAPWPDAQKLTDTKARHAAVLAKLQPKQQAVVAPPSAEPSLPEEPVIELTGRELGVEFNGPDDLPALRNAALAYYREHLQNSTAVMQDGTVVGFNRAGRGDSTSRKGDVLLRAVPAIKAIIEQGVVVDRVVGDRPHVIERIVIAAPVRVAGVVRQLAVSVNRTADGHFQYSLNFNRDAGEAPRGAQPSIVEVGAGSPRQTRGGRVADDGSGSLDATSGDFNLREWRPNNKVPSGWDEVEAHVSTSISDAERAAMLEIVREVSGLPAATFHRRITLPNGAPGWGKDAPTTAAGFYDPVADAIALAEDSATRRTAFHEAFHRLQRLFLTGKEKAVLRAETGRLRRIVPGNEFRRDQVALMSQKELEAEAFALYATGQARVAPHTSVRAVWDRLIQMLRRVVNAARGLGYQISEDIFEEAMAGRVARNRAAPLSGNEASAPSERSAAFARWFAGSQVVDSRGDPIRMFHGAKVAFDRFDTTLSELGTHFGTIEQANDISEGHGDQPVRPGAQTFPVFLAIKNPLRLEDRGDFFNRNVADQLQKLGIISQELAREVGKRGRDNQRRLQQAIIEAGHDGVVYLNRREAVPTRSEDQGAFEETVTDEAFAEKYPAARDSYIAFRPSQVKSAIGNRGTFDPDDDRIAFSASAGRLMGLPAGAAVIGSWRNDRPLKAHADYTAAKAGDIEAAARLIPDVVKPESVEEAQRTFGADVSYLPVLAIEASGHNRIPAMLAAFYAARTGAEVERGIVQANRAFHTGAGAAERLATRVRFDGPVQAGRRYVLVDDVTVMGSTLADLADHVRANGGEVAGVVTLVNASRMPHMVATPAQLREISRRFGNAIHEILGLAPESLTAPEASYLIGFRDADSLRARVAKARLERGDRLRAKGVQPGEDASQEEDGVDRREYSLPERPPVQPLSVDRQFPKQQGPRVGRPANVSVSRVIEELKGRLVDLQPALLKLIPLNYFPELAQPNMSAVQSYLRIKRDMDAYRGKKHAQADEIAQEWLRYMRLGFGVLPSKEGKAAAAALASLMHDATLAGIDPSVVDEKRIGEPDYEALRARFKELPKAGRDLFVKVRDAYVDQVTELDKLLLEAVRKAQQIARNKAQERYEAEIERIEGSGLRGEELRKAVEDAGAAHARELIRSRYAMNARVSKMRIAFENTRVPAPYFPLARFGRYFVSVRGADGAVISFSRREKAADRDRLAKEMRAAFPDAKVEVGVLDGSGAGIREQMDPRMVAEIEEILGGAGVDSSVMDQIWQRYLETMPDLSTRKRFIHRKGTQGFDADALRAFSSHMFHAAHQMGRIKYGLDLQEMTDQAVIQGRDAPDPTKGVTLANQLKLHHDWVMNPTGSAAAQIMTSTAFVWFLAASPAAALVNMTQTPMLGIPILGARFGAGKTAAALVRASADVFRGKSKSKLTEEEKWALERFYESGLIDRTQAHDLAGVGETGVNYSPLRARVMAVTSWMFHKAEVWNREVTALAAFRLARAKGESAHAAVDTAHDLTWKVHFDYSNASRPAMMQNDLAKVVLVFRNHSINMLYRMIRDTRQAFRGETPQARKEARYQLAGILGMQALMSGVKGIFAFNLVMALLGLAFGDDDDPMDTEQQFTKFVQDALGPELAGIVLNGAPGHYLKVDLTARIGMPDVWFRSPPTELEGRDEFQYWVMESLGASVGMVGDWKFAMDMAGEGKWDRAFEAMAPKGMRDLFKTGRYLANGVTSLAGDPLLEKTEIDPWTALSQAIGFTPAKVAETYERNNALKAAEKRILDRRRDLLNQFAAAVMLDDDDAKAGVLKRIKEFNAVPAHGAVAITKDTIKRSLSTRRRNAAKRVDGVLIQNEELGQVLRKELSESVYR